MPNHFPWPLQAKKNSLSGVAQARHKHVSEASDTVQPRPNAASQPAHARRVDCLELE